MADNVTLNPGVGGNVMATDDIGGIHFERVKLTLGADGANDGDVSSSNPIPAKEPRPATGGVTSVSQNAASVTLLASNTSRKGALFFNDSALALFLKCAATASTSSFTHKLKPEESWPLPHPCYTGIVDGIWEGAGGGAARITEFT